MISTSTLPLSIAAGLSEGRHRGAPFNDGDFYKWLEGACAVLAVTRDPELDRLLEEIILVIVQAQRPDGYLHTPVLIRHRNGDANDPPFQSPLAFETYNIGHLLDNPLMTEEMKAFFVALRDQLEIQAAAEAHHKQAKGTSSDQQA